MTMPSASRRTIEEELGLQATKVELGLQDEPRPIPIGQDDRFLVRRALGRGSMGTVYLAEDLRMNREVALKVVAPRRLEHGHLEKRLEREAQALAALRHENVVQAFDLASTEAGELFIAMEYVPGDNLRAWLRLGAQRGEREGEDEGEREAGRTRSTDEILEVFLGAARGLEAAHEAGIVHRDFKPDNVLVDDSSGQRRVLVSDFGLAGAEPHAQSLRRIATGTLTSTRGVLGTLAYMAPEQLRGERADARSDQHQFCVALWEGLTGQRPFGDEGRSPEQDESLPLRPPAIPRWVHRVLVQGLSFDPEQRHGSMTELIAVLEGGRRWRRRRPVLAAAAMVGAVALAVGLAVRPLPCEAADAAMTRAWTPEIRQRLDAALRERSEPYAAELAEFVVGTLDEAAWDWSQRATEVCLARHGEADSGAEVEPERRLEQRQICLERWADRFERRVAALGELGSSPDAFAHAYRLVAPLREPDRECRVPPIPIAVSVQEAVERSEESALLGSMSDAQREAERAVERAVSDGSACQPGGGRDAEGRLFSSELAAALLRLGTVQREAGAATQSLEKLGQAHTHALACDDGHRFIDARIHAAKISTVDLGAADDAAQALEEARAQMAKLQLPPTNRRRYEHEKALGLLASRQGDYEQSRRHYEQSLEALGEPRQRPIDAAKLLHNVGTAYQHEQRYDEAEQAYARALEVMRVLGAEHPAVTALAAKQGLARGQIAAEHGRFDAARRFFEQALSTASPRVAVMTYISLAQSEYEAEQMPRARRAAEAALELVEANPGLSPALVANAHGTAGQVLAELGDARALSLLDRALELWTEQDAATNAQLTRFHRALALHQLGRDPDARQALESLLAEPGGVADILDEPIELLSEELAVDADRGESEPSETSEISETTEPSTPR